MEDEVNGDEDEYDDDDLCLYEDTDRTLSLVVELTSQLVRKSHSCDPSTHVVTNLSRCHRLNHTQSGTVHQDLCLNSIFTIPDYQDYILY